MSFEIGGIDAGAAGQTTAAAQRRPIGEDLLMGADSRRGAADLGDHFEITNKSLESRRFTIVTR
jgi:hypothetical protein